MRLTVRDNVAEYVIACPEGCEVRQNQEGTDYLLVPDQQSPGEPYWLFDTILLESARLGEFGLRLVSEMPLN